MNYYSGIVKYHILCVLGVKFGFLDSTFRVKCLNFKEIWFLDSTFRVKSLNFKADPLSCQNSLKTGLINSSLGGKIVNLMALKLNMF